MLNFKHYTNYVFVRTCDDGSDMYTATFTYKDGYAETRTIFVKHNKLIAWNT